jgi:hypothetical protein
MIRTTPLLAVLFLLAHLPAASAAERWRLASVPLDMPLDAAEALDNQALEGLYQGDYGTNMPHNLGGYLGHNVKESGLDESPFYHIDTTLKDGRKLELWFSSESDGRKTFGIHFETPWSEKPTRDFKHALEEVRRAFGQPDLELVPFADRSTQRIQIFVDRTMPKARYDAVLARLPKAGNISKKDLDSFWRSDLRNWARILGPDFRGAIVILNDQNNKLTSEQAYLIDLNRARTVFNLDQIK